jgi:hypothetical protein
MESPKYNTKELQLVIPVAESKMCFQHWKEWYVMKKLILKRINLLSL